jgi:hypothetical protein
MLARPDLPKLPSHLHRSRILYFNIEGSGRLHDLVEGVLLIAQIGGPLLGANRKAFAHFETYRFCDAVRILQHKLAPAEAVTQLAACRRNCRRKSPGQWLVQRA